MPDPKMSLDEALKMLDEMAEREGSAKVTTPAAKNIVRESIKKEKKPKGLLTPSTKQIEQLEKEGL